MACVGNFKGGGHGGEGNYNIGVNGVGLWEEHVVWIHERLISVPS